MKMKLILSKMKIRDSEWIWIRNSEMKIFDSASVRRLWIVIRMIIAIRTDWLMVTVKVSVSVSVSVKITIRVLSQDKKEKV